MQRIKSKVTAILTSDWHLREDTPVCFIKDWHQEQWKAVEFVRSLQLTYQCPVFHAGDLFHHWKSSPALLSQTLSFLPQKFYTIYGQHDLPQHNWELRNKSGLHTLEVAGALNVLHGHHWGQEPAGNSVINIGTSKRICVWHNMTYQKIPFPGASGGMANKILRKYPQFDLIVTGDNHQSFVEEYQGRILVNPGSLTRQTADQIDFKPSVYLWHAENNSVERIFIPCQEGAISREHIERKEERDSRISAFISKLDSDWKAEMTFEENLEIFFQANNTREQIKELIYKAIE